MSSALVLTAGLGTRLDPLTRLVAKAAVPLAGRTLVERVLEWLVRQRITDVVLNLHHRPETITAVLGDGAHLGVRIRYSWEQPVLGSAGGPRHALPLLDGDPFVIVNGDTLSNVELAPMMEAFSRGRADVLLAVVPNPAPNHYNGLVLDRERHVTGVVPKGPGARGTWHFIGVQIARASVFASLPDGTPAETIAGIYGDMIARAPGRVQGWAVETPFVDVGTPADYFEAALTLAGTAGSAALVDPSAAIDASARLERTIVWPGARVGPDVRLTDCIVAGAILPAGFSAARQILMPVSVIRAGDAAVARGDVACFDLIRA